MEIWKSIPGYNNRYYVSNLGRVKSIIWDKQKIMKSRVSNAGYEIIRLFNGKYNQHSIHRLIMLSFIGDSKLDVNHIDGNKLNNKLENLEYVTKSQNMRHAYKNGLIKVKKGKEHHLFGKLGKDNKDSVKIKQLDLQGNLIKVWDSIADVKRELGLSAGNICMVCKGNRNHAGGYKWSYVA